MANDAISDLDWILVLEGCKGMSLVMDAIPRYEGGLSTLTQPYPSV